MKGRVLGCIAVFYSLWICDGHVLYERKSPTEGVVCIRFFRILHVYISDLHFTRTETIMIIIIYIFNI